MTNSPHDPVPEVSVVIPTYNRDDFLAECIGSVLNQTFQNFDLWVIDDGSTDDTRRVVARFQVDKRVRYLYQENQGDSKARSTGIRNSAGKYLAFLDSDDLWMPEKLERQVAVLRSHPDIGVVYAGALLQQIDERHRVVTERLCVTRALQESTVYEELLYGNFVVGSQSSVMVRRQALDRVGSYDESLPYMGDHDLWRRLSEHYRFYYLEEPLVCVRKHATNVSKNTEMMMESYRQYFAKLSLEIPARYRHHLPRIAIFRFTLWSLRLLRRGHLRAAIRAGWIAGSCACRNPGAVVGLLIRLVRLMRADREVPGDVQRPAGRPS